DNPVLGLSQPVVDKTGLTGTFDFVIDFAPQITGPLPPGVDYHPDPNAPTFLEALKEQLGLKLESGQTAPINTPIIDHIEEPTPN
ncbi:MAG TPA: TIGR03435 family protein, partial [Candidatus Aquilonibacter sp.]|nr:TIGR03435 family protein [Candidatus Aquilonibacter sp.]